MKRSEMLEILEAVLYEIAADLNQGNNDKYAVSVLGLLEDLGMQPPLCKDKKNVDSLCWDEE